MFHLFVFFTLTLFPRQDMAMIQVNHNNPNHWYALEESYDRRHFTTVYYFNSSGGVAQEFIPYHRGQRLPKIRIEDMGANFNPLIPVIN